MQSRIGPSPVKTLWFAVVHFAVAFTVGWLLTGSALVGGLLALVEPACNTRACHFHGELWAWPASRRQADATGRSPARA
jgi:uncharacterized membrane protein